MQTNELNIVFEGVFGSHLYGLEREGSDRDFKGIYVPSKRDIIFNRYKPVIEEDENGIDRSTFSLPKFVSMMAKADTVSFDMLHTPDHMTIQNSPLWKELRKNRADLYSKNMRGVLGYIRTQAFKYAHKVDRLREMKELLQIIESLSTYDDKIEHTYLPSYVKSRQFKFIQFTPEKGDIRENIDVCGSRYQTNADVSYLYDGLLKKVSRYGKRSEDGVQNGVDAKSMSHSLRVLIQLEEIIDTRDLVFPLVRKDEIMEMKLGKVSQEDCTNILTDMYDKVTEKLEASDLPEDPYMGNMEEAVMEYIDYLM